MNPRIGEPCTLHMLEKEPAGRKMEEAERKVALLYQTCYLLNGISWLVYLLHLVAYKEYITFSKSFLNDLFVNFVKDRCVGTSPVFPRVGCLGEL